MAKIAILGFGTVGSGVYEVLCRNAAGVSRRAGEPVSDAVRSASRNAVADNFQDYLRDLRDCRDGSMLEELDASTAFSNAARPMKSPFLSRCTDQPRFASKGVRWW